MWGMQPMIVFDKIKEMSIEGLAQHLVKNSSRLKGESGAFEFLSSEHIEKSTLDIYRVDGYHCSNCGGNRIAFDNMHYPFCDEWGTKYMCVDCGHFFHEIKAISTVPLYDVYYNLYVTELEEKFNLPRCIKGLVGYR